MIATPRLDYPAVIGCIRPAILLPISCLTNLSPSQIEAILAHELAHVRRHDYLVNLIQTIIETALFFHPAVWWISARITDDREDCCDDVAAEICGNRVSYANSLAVLETLRSPSPPVLAATGGVLLRRIQRIVGSSEATSRGTWWPVGALVMAMLVLLSIQTRSSADDAPTTHPAANARSIDVICMDESGKPIAGAEVYFIETLADAPGYTATKDVANADGVAHIRNLANAGKSRMGYQKAYARVPGQLAGVGFSIWGSPNFAAGPELLVYLRPVVPHRARLQLPDGIAPTSLRASVVSVHGAPPPGSNMSQVFSPSTDSDSIAWPEIFEPKVNANGTLELSDFPGDCTLMVKVSGPGIASRIVQWNKGQGAKEIAPAIDPESILEGSVFSDPPEAAVAGLEITAVSHDSRPADSSMIVSHRTKVLQDGTFRFHGLAAGTYQLSIEAIPAGWISAGLRSRILRGDTARDATIRLERGIVLSGRVVDAESSEPLTGAAVVADSQGNSSWQTTVWPDAQGRFWMRVPATPLRIYVNHFPDGYARTRDVPRQIRLDLSDPMMAADTPPLEFRLARNVAPQAANPTAPTTSPSPPVGQATVRGRVVDGGGKPIANARVFPEYTAADATGRSRPDGYYVVRSQVDGTFELPVQPRPEERIEFVASIAKWNTTAAVSKPFKPESEQTIDVGDLVVTPLDIVSQVSGVLQDEKRRPVANASVSIGPYARQVTSADGRFRFDLYDRNDPVSLMVQAPAFEPRPYNNIPAGADNVILTLTPHGVAWNRIPPSPLRLIGQPAPAVNLFQWLLNPPALDETMPVIRADGRKTVLLFPQCCVTADVYRQQMQAFEQLCRRYSVAGAVIFEPLYQEHTLKSMFDGIQLSVPVGIDQPTDQGYSGLYGLTKSRYGTLDRTGHTILIIDADGKVLEHMVTLDALERVLVRP